MVTSAVHAAAPHPDGMNILLGRAAPSQTLPRAEVWGNRVSPSPCVRVRPSRGRGRGETRFPHTPLRELIFTLGHAGGPRMRSRGLQPDGTRRRAVGEASGRSDAPPLPGCAYLTRSCDGVNRALAPECSPRSRVRGCPRYEQLPSRRVTPDVYRQSSCVAKRAAAPARRSRRPRRASGPRSRASAMWSRCN